VQWFFSGEPGGDRLGLHTNKVDFTGMCQWSAVRWRRWKSSLW